MKISKTLKWTRLIFALAIFSILMTAVITNITGRANAVAPVDASRWNLGLELYDSQVGGGTTPLQEDIITVEQPHASTGAGRRITLQINYEATDLDRDYNQNELLLKLEMPIKLSNSADDNAKAVFYHHTTNTLGMDYAYSPYSVNDAEIGASYSQNNVDQYDWSYSCAYQSNNAIAYVCTFKNNKTIEKNSSIRGTIQIVYNVRDNVGYMNAPLFVSHYNIDYRHEGKVTLNDTISSNTVAFGIKHERDVEWEKEKYYLGIHPYKLTSFDGFTQNQAANYTWVHYYYYGSAYPAPYFDLSSNRMYYPGPTSRYSYESPYDGANTPVTNYNLAQTYSNIPVKDWRWIDQLGDDVLVLDRELNTIEPDQDGNYLVSTTEAKDLEKCRFSYNNSAYLYYPGNCYEIYVGYPKNIYNAANNNYYIEGTAYSRGTYFQIDPTQPDNSEEQLASATRAISLSDFELEYHGDQIGLTKQMVPYNNDQIVLNSDEFKTTEGANLKYQFDAKAKDISQTPYDLTIGDDIIYYEDSTTGQINRLPEESYEYTNITANYQLTYSSGETSKCEDIGIKIYYRKRGETDMRQLSIPETGRNNARACGSVTLGYSSYIRTWDLPKGTVAWKIVVPDLDKSIEDLRYTTTLNIKSNDLPTNGTLHNFAYVQVLNNGQQLNTVTLSNYAEGVTRDIIATYDTETYGQYMQRALDSYSWEPFEMDPVIHDRYLSLQGNSMRYDTSTDSFIGNFTGYFYAHDYTLSGENNWKILKEKSGDSDDLYIKEVESYIIIPDGIKLNSSAEDIINSLSYCKIAPGDTYANRVHELVFNTAYECLQYMKSHATVTITNNWHNSGQTHIKLNIDYSDKKLSILNLSSSSVTLFSVDFNVSVPYDMWYEFDHYNTSSVYAFPMSAYSYDDGSWQYETDPTKFVGLYIRTDDNHTPRYYNYYNDRWVDTAPAGYRNLLPTISDINDNGDTTEKFRYSVAGLQSIGAISAEEAIRQTVITDQLTSYTPDDSYVSAGGSYNYKLLMRTGATRAYDATVYSNLETAFGNNSHWQGAFDGVDTSPADGLTDSNGKTIRVKTYYSTNPNAQSPNTDNSWQEYIEGTTDKSTVKSIAFRYLTDEGTPASIPGSTAIYSIVKLKAPVNEPSNIFAYNDFHGEWHDINTSNEINTDLHTLHSNVTKVQIDNKITVKVVKEWDDSNNRYNTRPSTVAPILRRNSELVDRTSAIDIASGESTLSYPNLHEYYRDQYNVSLNPIANYTTRLKSYDAETLTYVFESTLNTDRIKVITIWEDNQNEYNKRPANVDYNLLYKSNSDKTHQISTENDTEEFYFKDLPAYDISNFTVTTDPIDGYTTTLKVSSDGKTYTFTHRLTATAQITVKHIWDDEDNALGIRPTAIHFDRLHEGIPDTHLSLETEETEIEAKFAEVPLLELDDYVVEMTAIDPYITTMEYDPDTYTYTYISWIRPEPSDDDIPTVPNTGDTIMQYVVILAISVFSCGYLVSQKVKLYK